MSTFTRQAIIESFKKLIDEKPINKISVKDIVEDCGVNRNTFYYHFEDIPELVETILKQEADTLLDKCEDISSIEKCLEISMKYASGRKKALLHIYNSVSRDVYEKYLMQICKYAVQRWFDFTFPSAPLDEKIRSIIIRTFKCELFGVIIDWLNHSMDEEFIESYKFVTELRKGEIERLYEKAMKK